MASAGVVHWKLLDWFGEVNGIKNVSNSDADDVVIHTGDNKPLEFESVQSGESIAFQCESKHVSISWSDGAGMHADIIVMDP